MNNNLHKKVQHQRDGTSYPFLILLITSMFLLFITTDPMDYLIREVHKDYGMDLHHGQGISGSLSTHNTNTRKYLVRMEIAQQILISRHSERLEMSFYRMMLDDGR